MCICVVSASSMMCNVRTRASKAYITNAFRNACAHALICMGHASDANGLD